MSDCTKKINELLTKLNAEIMKLPQFAADEFNCQTLFDVPINMLSSINDINDVIKYAAHSETYLDYITLSNQAAEQAEGMNDLNIQDAVSFYLDVVRDLFDLAYTKVNIELSERKLAREYSIVLAAIASWITTQLEKTTGDDNRILFKSLMKSIKSVGGEDKVKTLYYQERAIEVRCYLKQNIQQHRRLSSHQSYGHKLAEVYAAEEGVDASAEEPFAAEVSRSPSSAHDVQSVAVHNTSTTTVSMLSSLHASTEKSVVVQDRVHVNLQDQLLDELKTKLKRRESDKSSKDSDKVTSAAMLHTTGVLQPKSASAAAASQDKSKDNQVSLVSSTTQRMLPTTIVSRRRL